MKIHPAEQRRRAQNDAYWAAYRAQRPVKCRFIHDWLLHEYGLERTCLRCGLTQRQGVLGFFDNNHWLSQDSSLMQKLKADQEELASYQGPLT